MSYATSLPAATIGQGNVPVSASYYLAYRYSPLGHGNEREEHQGALKLQSMNSNRVHYEFSKSTVLDC